MNPNYWGILIMVIGSLLAIGGATKSEFVLYRPLVAKSRILWGDNVYRFHLVSGILVMVAGGLMAAGLI